MPEVARWPTNPIYLFLDATCVKVRDGGRVVLSMAALVAVGVASTGERRILAAQRQLSIALATIWDGPNDQG